MPSDTPTMPPREPTLADVYALQVAHAEQLATVLGIVRALANEVAALHEAMQPHNLAPLVKAASELPAE